MESSLTRSGLAGIRAIPYGTHMCHFYRDRDDLAGSVVPYVGAGLAAGERCVWVTCEPLGVEGAVRELARSGVDVEAEISRGSLLIRDCGDWYQRSGTIDAGALSARWIEAETRALEDGYAGLRATGNVGFLTHDTWPRFMEYEASVERAIRSRRITALCSYSRASCGVSEVFDVVRQHGCALDRVDEGWQVLPSPL